MKKITVRLMDKVTGLQYGKDALVTARDDVEDESMVSCGVYNIISENFNIEATAPEIVEVPPITPNDSEHKKFGKDSKYYEN